MPFDKQQAEEKLRDVMWKIKEVSSSIQNDILRYREKDTLVDEEDEYKTMRDIRLYVLKNYERMDRILDDLRKYR